MDNELEWEFNPVGEDRPVDEPGLSYRQILHLAVQHSNLPADARHIIHVIATSVANDCTCPSGWPDTNSIAADTGLPVETVDRLIPMILDWELFVTHLGDYTIGEA